MRDEVSRVADPLEGELLHVYVHHPAPVTQKAGELAQEHTLADTPESHHRHGHRRFDVAHQLVEVCAALNLEHGHIVIEISVRLRESFDYNREHVWASPTPPCDVVCATRQYVVRIAW